MLLENLSLRDTSDVVDKIKGAWCLFQSPIRGRLRDYDFHSSYQPSENLEIEGHPESEVPSELRVLTVNAYGMKHPGQLLDDIKRARDDLQGLDVLALNEVADLAHDFWADDMFSGMLVAYAPDNFYEVQDRNRGQDCTSTGNALVTSFGGELEVRNLPKVTWNYHGNGQVMVRNAIILDAGELQCGTTHTDIYTSRFMRDFQFGGVVDRMNREEALLLGDFNLFYGPRENLRETISKAGFKDFLDWEGHFADHILARGMVLAESKQFASDSTDHPFSTAVYLRTT